MLKRVCTRIFTVLFLMSCLAFSPATQAGAATLRYAVNNTHPLNLVGYYYTDPTTPTQLWSAVPAEMKPYTAIVLHAERHLYNTAEIKNWIHAKVDECQANSINCVIQTVTGETGPANVIPLSFWEEMLRDHSVVIGLNAAELYNNSDQSQYVADNILVCAKYGAYFIWTDTNIGNPGLMLQYIQNNPNLIAAMRANKDNVIMMYKSSFSERSTDSVCLGAWLAGIAGNWGVSSDWWHWQLDGYCKLFGGCSGCGDWKKCATYPETMYLQDMLRVASEGATCFLLEAGWYSNVNQGRITPGYQYVIKPFLSRVIDGSMHIPGRDEVLGKNKFAYIGRSSFSVPYESPYSNLYMSTGRYGIIPLLPTNLNAAELANFENTSTTARDKAYFDSLYPEETINSDTFCSRNGSTWYWMNSSENTQIYQSSKFAPKVNPSSYFSIGAGPHTAAAITEAADRFKIHLNNYRVNKDSIHNGVAWSQAEINTYIHDVYSANPDDDTLRTTLIKVNGQYNGGQPQILISGDNGFTYNSSWDAAYKEYTLTVNHNGQVNIEILSNQAGTGQSGKFSIEGESGRLNGAAAVRNLSVCSGGKYVGEIGGNSSNYVTLDALTEKAGTYKMDIYSVCGGTRDFYVSVNGRIGQKVSVTGPSWNQLAPVVTLYVSLEAGNNTLKFYNNTSWAPDLDMVTLETSTNTIGTGVEAESGSLSGQARINNVSFCSGGKNVGNIGNSTSNYVTLNVNVQEAGIYKMEVYSVVEGSRSFFVSVNGGTAQKVDVTGNSWNSLAPVTAVNVSLSAGSNTIKFHNNTSWAPDLDRIVLLK